MVSKSLYKYCFTLAVALEPKHKSKIQALKSKQIEMESQIRRQGQLLSALFFEAFPYFQSLRILANAANFS